MTTKRCALPILLFLLAWLIVPATAVVQTPANPAAEENAAQAAYLSYAAAIHSAQKAASLPQFAHTSPLNSIKLADTPAEEKEILDALKEMTPQTVALEGKIAFNDRLYFFFAGNPEQAVKKSEYFPVTVEMVKEDGMWRLRRQQSWHVKNGSDLSHFIPKGKERVRRFQDLLAALTTPVPQSKIAGTIEGKPFRPTEVYFLRRDGYFRLDFHDGNTRFGVYVRDPSSFAEVQNQHYKMDPLDGLECDYECGEAKAVFVPYCAKLSFGRLTNGLLPGTISLALRTPVPVNLQGLFVATEQQDGMSPDQ
jgi:hypothetical protein